MDTLRTYCGLGADCRERWRGLSPAYRSPTARPDCTGWWSSTPSASHLTW